MNFSPEIVAEYRLRLAQIREQGRQLFEGGPQEFRQLPA